jgi:beta-glucanase (GH16 family)
MKKTNLILLLLILVSFYSCYERDNKRGWKLVWEDNFNQKNGFDTTSWSKIPRGTSDWKNYMSDFDELYSVEDGNLILRGVENTKVPDDTARFLTGGLYTKDKKSFMNGRLEIRARLESAQGAWPAFWLLPEKENRKWPDDGEIDIMEHLNYDTIAYQTVHSYYTYILGIRENPKSGGINTINPDEYNVYAVELSPDSLSFFINDNHTFTYKKIETELKGQYPFNAPFYLLLDMQLGGSWVGKIAAEELPVSMYIDWVRFYKAVNK